MKTKTNRVAYVWMLPLLLLCQCAKDVPSADEINKNVITRALAAKMDGDYARRSAELVKFFNDSDIELLCLMEEHKNDAFPLKPLELSEKVDKNGNKRADTTPKNSACIAYNAAIVTLCTNKAKFDQCLERQRLIVKAIELRRARNNESVRKDKE